MEDKIIEELYYKSFINIDYIYRYEKIMDKYNHDLDHILKKMDKPTIVRIFKELGYVFKKSSPGQFYVFYETIANYSFKVSFQISGGIVIPYIYIYISDIYLKINHNNLTFLYRYLIGNMDKTTNQPTFINYRELELILIDIMSIYEDFKTEFLRLLEENGLLE